MERGFADGVHAGARGQRLEEEAIKRKDIQAFIDSLVPGDIVYAKGNKKKYRIIFRKFEHYAMTDKGCFIWIDMYKYCKEGLIPSECSYEYIPA